MTVTPKELREVFDAAVEIGEPDRRAEYVRSACRGNEPLRLRVEELLEAHERAGGFCNAPEPGRGPAGGPGTPGLADLPSERIGRYKLLQKLGEGGCGAVFMAEQTEPVKRRVALKIIKLGMDTRSVIARFEAERQALAMMDHPNIARVLDAGSTEAGRPFFVMELVRGIKITDYCDQNQLSTNARLKLFSQVCQAVQHAHHKGVIHRDLKPSNVLVTSNDGTPLAKVIDFGVAKATGGQQLTDKTLFTRFEMFIGTPAYMSPEQAEFNASDVDTRTDIYALGVLLYELITGQTPFDSETLLQSGLEAMRRLIRDTDPPRPSTRLNTLAAADLSEVARRRQSEPPKLISLVRGDLDWIVLKALEKDRTRRYETANALAMDVQRHLNHEPIVARPPSALYSFQKMAQRNRTAFAAAIALFGMLVLGVVASSWQALRATRAEKDQRQLRLIADGARQEATLRAEETRQQLVRLHLATGNKLVEEADYFGALLRFVEALRLDFGKPEQEEVHRRRLASILRASPQLRQMWFLDGYVHSAEFSPDGKRVVAAGLDHTARVWHTTTGEPALPPIRLGGSVDFASFTPDGRRLIAVSQGQLRFWDAQSGQPVGAAARVTAFDLEGVGFSPDGRWLVAPVPGGLQRFRTETGEPEGPGITTTNQLDRACFSADGARVAAFGTGAKAGGLWDWNARTGPTLAMTFSHDSIVRLTDLNPNGKQVATVTGARILNVWNVLTGTQTFPPFEPGGDLFDCRFSPDGRWLATASWSGVARVFDAATGQVHGEPMHHGAGVARSVFSPDGYWLATASWDNTARVWDSATGRPASTSLRHAGFVGSVNFSPDGKQLLTAGQDQAMRLWDFTTNSPARRILFQRYVVKRARFSRDGKRVLTCGDSPLMLWDVSSGKRVKMVNHPDSFGDAAFSPDGQRVLLGGLDGKIPLWDISGEPVQLVSVEHPLGTTCVGFSPDGESFFTVGGKEVRVWRTSDGGLLARIEHADVARYADYSPDGRRLVTASADRTARVWDAQTGQPLGAPLEHPCEVRRARFSPDGRRVVTATWDLTLLARAAQIWDVETSQREGPPLQHQDGLHYAEFSPDGRFVATAGEDNMAAVWDAATGQRVAGPLRHKDTVVSASFSPDSRLLLTVSSDFTARVWDVSTGEAVTPPLRHNAPATSGVWSPDGREVLTSAEDGTARLWDVSPTPAPLSELQRQVELLAAHRLDPNIGPVLLTPAEMRERWQASRVRK